MLAERTSPEMHGGYSDQDAAAEDMSLDEMLRIQRNLEEQIRQMGGVTTEQSPHPPKQQSRGGRFTSRLQNLQSSQATPEHTLEATKARPSRIDVGQPYEVIFKKPVAVRTGPDLNAPFFRSLAPGSRVELFEWDTSRRWRRITLSTVAESHSDRKRTLESDADLPDYLQAALGPSTRRTAQEKDESSGGKTLEQDGWVLIAHPELGQLLQAVQLADESETRMDREGRVGVDAETSAAQSATVPPSVRSAAQSATVSPSMQSTMAQLDFDAKAKAFDMAWGNMPFVPSTQNVARKQQAPVPFVNANFSKETQEELQVLESVEEKPGLQEPTVMRATRAGNYEVVKSILGRSADANAADALGETALMEASAAGRTDLVALLLLHGADLARAVPGGHEVALAMAVDEPTKALLASWHGLRAEKRHLQAALHCLQEQDALRVSKRLGIIASTSEPPLESIQSDGYAGDDGFAEAAQVADTGMQQSSSSTALVPGVRYKVVYKKVTVRQHPNKDSKSLGSKRLGDIVIAFEWDETRSWRRVKIDLAVAAGTETQMDTDGWMLVHSTDVGPLLEECNDSPDSDDDDADEGAG